MSEIYSKDWWVHRHQLTPTMIGVIESLLEGKEITRDSTFHYVYDGTRQRISDATVDALCRRGYLYYYESGSEAFYEIEQGRRKIWERFPHPTPEPTND